MSEQAAAAPEPLCAICQSSFDVSEEVARCPSCAAPYHSDCWDANGGCALYGCPMVPKTEGLKPLEIQPAFWGREDKDCPKCGNKILAMAVRCRHCGTQLEATPIDQSAYARKQAQKERAPFLRRMSIIFMILAIIPGGALLTLTLGWWFYARNRTAIRKLPGGADGLYRIAIIVSAVEIVVSLIGVTTFSIIDRLVR